MTHRTNPANSSRQRGHLGKRAPFTKFLEPSKLGDMETGILHCALIVQVDRDLGMAFNSSDRINQNFFWHTAELQNEFCWLDPAPVRQEAPLGQNRSCQQRADSQEQKRRPSRAR